MKTLANNNSYNESVNGMSQVLTIKVGDRVKVKSQDTPADVIAISNDGKWYTVKFVRPVREFWTDDIMTKATYSRYGITKNYDRMTGEEQEGNATYYAEQLKYGCGGIHEYELNGFAMRIESTREDVEPDNREGWGNEYRVTIHHQTGDTIDTMTLSEAAELLARLYTEAKAATLETASEITEKPQPSSWITDYTYDDFAKLEANPEAIEADPDIMGKRFRLTAKDGSAPLSELQVFIQDYAGNERHALYYIWDEWMQEVRANVRPLDWLREHFCHANGWQLVAA